MFVPAPVACIRVDFYLILKNIVFYMPTFYKNGVLG